MPEPRFRLVVMDLDGTLLNERSEVSPRTRAVLQLAHDAGVDLTVATGRSYSLIRYFCGSLPLSGPQITFNGAVVVDPVSDKPIFLQAVPQALVVPVLDFLSTENVYTCFYTEHDIFVRERAPLELALVPPGCPPPIEQPHLEDLAQLACLKIVVVADPARIDLLRPTAEQAFGDRLYVTQTAPVLLEFLHPAVSKGAALRKIIQDRGLRAEEVIAFGDSHNDLDLLQVAGTGVAMANATPEVLEAADYIALSNRQDGIAAALDELLWT